jgi:cyanophycinase
MSLSDPDINVGVDMSSIKQQGPGYTSYLTGNAGDVQRATRAGLALCGGGTDVDEAFRFLLDRSGGGDVLVLRASGADGYNDYIAGLGQVDSVESVVCHDRQAAFEAELVEKVDSAEAIFFAGGDQGNYLEYWRGTPLQAALQRAIERNVPVGGTSAGLAVLGDPVFAAPEGEVFSPDVLANPFHSSIELEPAFLATGHLRGIVTDTHFSQRERLGRLIGFVSRSHADGRACRGLGVDEKTALLVNEDGLGTVVGRNAVVLVELQEPPAVCSQGKPLSVADVQVRRLRAGDTLQLSDWSGAGQVQTYSVTSGQLSENPKTPS